MGQSISIERAEEQGYQEDTIEHLRLIQQMMIAKCEGQAKKMKVEAFKDKRFPILAVVEKTEKFFVRAEKVAAEEIERHISGVIDSEFIGGFMNTVSGAVNDLLKDATVTEQQRSGSHVVFANSSFLRVNYYLYKYEFSSRGLKAMFKNAVCYMLHVGVLDIKNTDSNLLKNELNSTIGTNIVSSKLSKKILQSVSSMSFLYKRITHLQSVFGVENKSISAFKSILRYLLNIYQIEVPIVRFRRSVRSGQALGSTSGVKQTGLARKPRKPSPVFPFTPLHPNPNLSTASQLTKHLEQSSGPSFGTVQERERRKRKQKLKIQKERDKKANWEGEN